MKTLHTIASLAAALSAGSCGDEGPPPPMELELAPAYLGTGVVRVTRELQPDTPLQAFRFRLEMSSVASGNVSARTQRSDAPGFALTGRYDVGANEVRFDPSTEVSLTSSRSEQLVRFSFRPEDGVPEDGRASELVGSVSSATVGGASSGRWVGVEAVADQVPTPDPTRIEITASPRPGRVLVEGGPGASMGGAGVQLFRFSPRLEVPDVFTVPVRFSGEFVFELPADPGDIILIRGQVARRNGDAAILRVPR